MAKYLDRNNRNLYNNGVFAIENTEFTKNKILEFSAISLFSAEKIPADLSGFVVRAFYAIMSTLNFRRNPSLGTY